MKFKRLFSVGILSTALIFSTLVFYPAAEAATGLNVSSHTQQEIEAYIKASGVTTSTATTYATTPVKDTVRGDLSSQTKNDALAMLNNVRYIAGLDPVTLDAGYGDLAQAGAFVNMSIGKLTHYPNTDASRPAGMSQADWEAGVEGAGKCNLASGYKIVAAALGWTYDSDSGNIDRIGHRRWCLNPKMGKTGFGSAGAYSAMYSLDRSGSGSQTNVAWPAANMPVDYFGKNIPWSLSVGSTVNKAGVTVKLTRVGDGKTWTFSGSESYSTSSAKYFNVNNDGYGQSGCIIFRPDGISGYEDGDTFNVEITGVGSGTIAYTVRFFDTSAAEQPEHDFEFVKMDDDGYKSDCVIRCRDCGITKTVAVPYDYYMMWYISGKYDKQVLDGEFWILSSDTIKYQLGQRNYYSPLNEYYDDVVLEAADPANCVIKQDRKDKYSGTVTISKSGVYTIKTWMKYNPNITHTCIIHVRDNEQCSHTHTEVRNAKAVTCINKGRTGDTICSDCGKLLVASTDIPAEGHKTEIRKETITQATCTTPEKYREIEHCTICDQDLTIWTRQGKKDPDAHTDIVKDAAVSATCTQNGKTEGSHCAACGKTIVAQKSAPATGHDWGEWTVVVPATKTAEGVEQRVCKKDPSHVDVRSIPKTDPSPEGEGGDPDQKDSETTEDTSAADTEKIISIIPANVSLESSNAIVAARKAYDALSTEQKEKVDPSLLGKLLAAEDSLAKAVVSAVMDLPESAGPDDEQAVERIYKIYDSMTDSQKALIDPKALTRLDDVRDSISGSKEYEAAVEQAASLRDSTFTLKSKAGRKMLVILSPLSKDTAYQVRYSTSSKFTKKSTKTVNVKAGKKTVTFKKLKAKKKYYVIIRPVSQIQNKATGEISKVYGFWSSVKKIKVKK